MSQSATRKPENEVVARILLLLRRHLSELTANSLLDSALERTGLSAARLQQSDIAKLLPALERGARLFMRNQTDAEATVAALLRLANTPDLRPAPAAPAPAAAPAAEPARPARPEAPARPAPESSSSRVISDNPWSRAEPPTLRRQLPDFGSSPRPDSLPASRPDPAPTRPKSGPIARPEASPAPRLESPFAARPESGLAPTFAARPEPVTARRSLPDLGPAARPEPAARPDPAARRSLPDLGTWPVEARADPKLRSLEPSPEERAARDAQRPPPAQVQGPSLVVVISREDEIVRARGEARRMAEKLGASVSRQTQLATAVSELARNIFLYAGGRGAVELALLAAPHRGVDVVARDQGPGIADVALVLDGNYRSKLGMGLGLRGVRRLASYFEVNSVVGAGTVVRAQFRIDPNT